MARSAVRWDTPRASGSFLAGWRGLGRFWLLVILLIVAAGGTLQWLGPAPPPRLATIRPVEHLAPPAAIAPSGRPAPQPVVPPVDRPGRDAPGPITDPDPALLEPAVESSGEALPRIAADGRMPMQVYASGFDRTTRRPKVGLLVAGIGLNEEESLSAIRNLPAGVTLAISPYGAGFRRLLAAARSAEHEYLISLPMEPQGFPLNDPGPRALMTSLAPQENMERLHQLLSRISGYVGATGALGMMRGERFAALTDQMDSVLADLAARGLLYVDARPGQAPLAGIWNRSIDLVIDTSPAREDIEAGLDQLGALALDKGSAVGLVGVVRPMTVERIGVWVDRMADRGLVLAPLSALVQMPGPRRGETEEHK